MADNSIGPAEVAGAAVIALMAKAPLPGAAKTRLAGLLGPEGAADLYRHFLADTLATTRRVNGTLQYIVCPDEEHRRALVELAPAEVGVVVQSGPGLMAGLAWALSTLSAAGAAKVLLIDADSPTLPAELLVEALRHLDTVDVCLGPCPDGGYYLVGARRDCPGLFDGVAASTAGTFEQTVARARTLGHRTSLLPAWPDVDTPEDFHALVAQLREGQTGATATRAWLQRTGWLEGNQATKVGS